MSQKKVIIDLTENLDSNLAARTVLTPPTKKRKSLSQGSKDSDDDCEYQPLKKSKSNPEKRKEKNT